MARIFLRSNHKQTIFIDSVCSAENYLGQQAFMDGHVVSAAAKIAVHSRNYMHLICTETPQFNNFLLVCLLFDHHSGIP
jgi:hypothetical protein